MIHETNTLRPDSLSASSRAFLTEDMLLFDIETTGLSPARDTVYCIGCGYLDREGLRVELFFAECPADEAEVISSFARLAETHPTLVTFNGTTFDLPFLKKRGGFDPAASVAHIDLYREVRAMQNLLKLPSCRQKAVEQFLGCAREGLYTGGELIAFYQRYVTDPDPDLLAPLLLHNREDVIGMFDLLGILAYQQFREGRFQIADVIEEQETDRRWLSVKLQPDLPLPQSLTRLLPDAALLLDRESALIRFPLQHGELKYFFENPRDYYYLPDEDRAVHKSVGQFVDAAHRVRATRENCYTKRECDYLTLPIHSDRFPMKKACNAKESCLEIPADTQDLKDALTAYFSLLM